MPEHAFHIRLKKGQLSRYIKLHSPVPASIITQLKNAGVYDFSIFANGENVFGLMHFDDRNVFKETMQNNVDPSWTQAVIDICEVREVDPELNSLKGLERVFRLD